jgi:membrane protein
MADSNAPEPPEAPPPQLEIEPTVAGRLARWAERGRILRGSIESARSGHASVDVAFTLVERDSGIGGGLLAGALAYRLFVLLLPSALLFVSGLGLYADTVDKSSRKVAEEAGLHGLIASQVASSASSSARWIVIILTLPAVLYALVKLYRAIAIVHALAWEGSGRGVRIRPKGVSVLGAALLVVVVAAAIVGWIRSQGQLGGIAALAVYLPLVGGSWLVVSRQLAHRDAPWHALLPGALLFGAGLLFVNAFNVYVTTRAIADQANTYGALGIAAALLFSLVLVGRLIVVSAELNATIVDRRRARDVD